MTSSVNFVEYVIDILSPIWTIRSKKMFGEYGIYCNEVFFAMVCDDILYFQCDEPLLAEFPETGYPYPGSRLAGMAGPDLLEDRDTLHLLARKSYEYKCCKPVSSRRRSK